MKYMLVQFLLIVYFMFPIHSKSTSTFCLPGKFVKHIAKLKDHFHISFITESHPCDLLKPNFFMHATAVDLSVNTFA